MLKLEDVDFEIIRTPILGRGVGAIIVAKPKPYARSLVDFDPNLAADDAIAMVKRRVVDSLNVVLFGRAIDVVTAAERDILNVVGRHALSGPSEVLGEIQKSFSAIRKAIAD